MEVNINARHGELSEDIQAAMSEKATKLTRLFDKISGVQVIAEMEHTEPKVEIIVHAEHANDFFASDSGTNVVVAFDNSIAKIEQQLRKHKEKLTAHRDKH